MYVPFLERRVLLLPLSVAHWRGILLVLLERWGAILRRWIRVHADMLIQIAEFRSIQRNNIRADCWIIKKSEARRQ